MLPGHDGLPMICLSIAGIEHALDHLVVTILAEHEERFGARAGLRAAFGRDVDTVVLAERTRSQSETVAATLRALKLDEPFLVKDSDGAFDLSNPQSADNYVCCESLHHFDLINARNKSYIQVDSDNQIIAIREKAVISDLFNVGGYYFLEPRRFLETFDRLSLAGAANSGELYLSHVIAAMLAEGERFQARRVTRYRDWGTVHEWRRELLERRTYFVLLDGFVFERGSEYFRPTFAEIKPNALAVEAIKALAAQGHSIVYLSIRPESLSRLTQSQVASAGLPDGPFVWNCPVAKWMLITAPHATLPFTTCSASELPPEQANLLLTARDA